MNVMHILCAQLSVSVCAHGDACGVGDINWHVYCACACGFVCVHLWDQCEGENLLACVRGVIYWCSCA